MRTRLRWLVAFVLACLVVAPAALAEEVPDAGHDAVIEGVVVDTEGRPLPGVPVEVSTYPPFRWFLLPDHARESFDDYFRPPSPFTPNASDRRVGRTDAEGGFRFEGMQELDSCRARARPAPPLRGRIVAPCGVRGPLRLVVEGGRVLEGRLVDAEGVGVRGWIGATALRPPAVWFQPSWPDDALVEEVLATEDDGTFRVVVPKARRVRLDAHVPGRMVVAGLGVIEPDEDDVTLVLPTTGGACVRGTVRDVEGRPIEGARIMANAHARDGIHHLPGVIGVARTDAKGAYRIDHLPAHTLARLSVEAPGHAVWQRWTYATPLVEGRPLVVDVTLVGVARLTLHVADEDGRGLAHAKITLQLTKPNHMGQSGVHSFHADGEGVIRIDDMPACGAAILVAEAPGHYLPPHPNPTPYVGPFGRTLPSLEPGASREATVVMRRGATLHGQVVDAKGMGAGNARLGFRLFRSDVRRGSSFESRSITTDVEGRFALTGLPPLAHLYVHVEHADHPGLDTTLDPEAMAEGESVRLVLPKPAQVAGRVLDPAGKPVSGVGVVCQGARHPVLTDAAGRFVFPAVFPGRQGFCLGTVPVSSSMSWIDLQAGGVVSGLVLRHPGGVEHVIEGVVLHADGSPAPLLAVGIRNENNGALTDRVYADAEGRFRIARVPPGRYVVSCDAARAPVTVGSERAKPVTLTLTAPPSHFVLDGEVVDVDGRPVDSAVVRIANPHDGAFVTRGQTVLMGGHFRARIHGAPRELTIRVQDARDATGRRLSHAPNGVTVHGRPGESCRVQLAPSRSVRVRVLDTAGKPIPNLPATLTRQSTSRVRRNRHVPPIQATTDAEGRFVVEGLDGGPYYLGLQLGQDWFPPGQILTQPGSDEHVVRVHRWQTLVTIVTAPDGLPVKGCPVELYALSEKRPQGRGTVLTDEAGRAEHQRLRPQEELAIRVLPPHARAERTADLVPAVKAGVSPGGEPLRVRLGTGARLGGRVVDAAGRPIPGASVNLLVPKRPPGPVDGLTSDLTLRQQIRTDESGAFLFRRLPSEAVVSITVTGPKGADPAYFPERVEALETGRETIEVVLQGSVSIEGTVPNIEPRFLEGLMIRARPLLSNTPSARFRFDGTTRTFELKGLRPGPYKLHLRSGREIRYERVQQIEAPATGVVLTITRVHALGGVTMGAEGKPFRVALYVPGHEPIRTSVQPDGVFRFSGLPDARGPLVVYREGDTRVALVEDVYTGRGDPLVVELIEGKPIRGRIVGTSKPLAGGRVIATRGLIRFEGTVTEKGVFETPALPPGPWKLTFTFDYPKEGSVPAPESVEAGTTDLILEWADG